MDESERQELYEAKREALGVEKKIPHISSDLSAEQKSLHQFLSTAKQISDTERDGITSYAFLLKFSKDIVSDLVEICTNKIYEDVISRGKNLVI